MKRFSRSFAFLLMLVLMLACATVFAFASDADAGLPEAGEGAEYDGSYTNSKGETTYFKGQLGFEAAMDDAIATATYNTRNTVCEIKLFNDVEYYKAFCKQDTAFIKIAESMDTGYCFPSRLEDIDVLKDGFDYWR